MFKTPNYIYLMLSENTYTQLWHKVHYTIAHYNGRLSEEFSSKKYTKLAPTILSVWED